MTHAHPGISPLDFRIHPDDLRLSSFPETTRRVYELLYNRAIAALAPHPVWEEVRRIGTVDDTVVAVGWIESREDGWTVQAGEELRPKPAIPSTPGHAPIQALKGVMKVTLEQENAGPTLADLLNIMKSEGIGRPSTYASAVSRLAVTDHWIDISPEGFVSLSEKGSDVISMLENEQSLPQLNSEFTRTIEKELDAIECGATRPSELMQTLESIIGEGVVRQLDWLNEIGEPLAGEPAEMSYARRDRMPIPVPSTPVHAENPETMLAADDPLRSLREQYLGAIIQSTGKAWWQKSVEERTALSVYIVTVAMRSSLEDRALANRLKYDALVQWVLGVTGQPSHSQLLIAKRWWKTIDLDVQNHILEIAESVIETLRLVDLGK